MSKSIECASCGTEIEDPDNSGAYWHEDYKSDICDECYREETDTCQLCGDDDLMPSGKSEFIVVKCELAVTADRPPGIYRIMSRPFLSIPLIGSASMDGNDVVFTGPLPKRDSEYDISGYVCKTCARPYHRTFQGVYGTPAAHCKNSSWHRSPLWPPLLAAGGNRRGDGWEDTRGCYGWYLEKSHVQSTIRNHPEMLRDLECEPDNYQWQDFFKLFELGNDVRTQERPWEERIVCRHKTWHDWLALEHLGVKIYFTSEYQGMYGEDRWKQLALRPDPKYRESNWNEKNPMLIYTHGLPTIETVKRNRKYEPWTAFSWHPDPRFGPPDRRLTAKELRAAVILAIERGAKGFYRNAPGSIHADGVVL